MTPADSVVTVVTATYDRGWLLPRLYQSLLDQTFREFDWLIVDDGSTDDTAAIVTSWQREGRLKITYFKQQNQGKHVALNRAFERASGQFCAVIDSDDWYLPQALERLVLHWRSIPSGLQPMFANLEGLSAFADGTPVGDRFPQDVFDSDLFEVRYRFKVQGDTCGMYRTDVLRKFPFPEDLGRFVTDSLVWQRIARTYRSRYFNEVLRYVEYREEGLSGQKLADHTAWARGNAVYYHELAAMPNRLPASTRLKAAAQAVRYTLHARQRYAGQVGRIVPRPHLIGLVALPIGVALYVRDRLPARVQRPAQAGTETFRSRSR